MKKVKVFITLLCPTLCDPVEGSLPGSSVPEISKASILERLSFSIHNCPLIIPFLSQMLVLCM